MTSTHVNYVSWFFRVLGWDGVMPVIVAMLPSVIEFLLPNNRHALEITALATPAIMFLLRLIVGKRHISSNRCSAAIKRLQYCVFYFAILLLGFLDGVLILSHLMPDGTFKSTDYLVFAILIFIYLTSMTIAMYPGRTTSLDDMAWPNEAFDTQNM